MDNTNKEIPDTQVLVKIDPVDPKKSQLLIRKTGEEDQYVDALIFTPNQMQIIDEIVSEIDERTKAEFKKRQAEKEHVHTPFFKKLFGR
jgi:hypothetical protein